MQTRREMLSHSAKVAAMLVAVGVAPGLAQAQSAGFNSAAFAAKTLPERPSRMTTRSAPRHRPGAARARTEPYAR